MIKNARIDMILVMIVEYDGNISLSQSDSDLRRARQAYPRSACTHISVFFFFFNIIYFLLSF